MLNEKLYTVYKSMLSNIKIMKAFRVQGFPMRRGFKLISLLIHFNLKISMVFSLNTIGYCIIVGHLPLARKEKI